MKEFRAFNLDSRDIRLPEVEEREAKSGDFTGHAAVFNQPTIIGGRGFGFVEVIAPNAFANVLRQDVRFLVNHEGLPLARTSNNSLMLMQDHLGLRNDAVIAPTAMGRDVVILLQRGDINQQSFAFTVRSDDWVDLEDNKEDEPFKNDGPITDGSDQLDSYERTIQQAKEWGITDLRIVRSIETLYDVSVVTYPAYEGATGGVRCQRGNVKDIETHLREIHGAKDAAKAAQDLYNQRLSAHRAKRR